MPEDTDPPLLGEGLVRCGLVGAAQGALAGPPCGVLIFWLVAPFQDHTWPGILSVENVGLALIFGLACGAVLGGVARGGAELGSVGLRIGAWFVAGALSPLTGAVACVVAHRARHGEIADPRAVVLALLRGTRGVRPADFGVASVMLGVGLACLAATLERHPSRRRVFAIASVTATLAVSSLGFGDPCIISVKAASAAVAIFGLLVWLRLTRPLTPKLGESERSGSNPPSLP